MPYPVILAVDSMSLGEAHRFLQHVHDLISGVKVQSMVIREGAGPIAHRLQMAGLPLWGDIKQHDTPDAAYEQAMELKKAGFSAVTVHTLGGQKMMTKVKTTGLYVVGATELTSTSDTDIRFRTGRSRADQVRRLALEAAECGLDAVVCSANEVAELHSMPQLAEMDLIVTGVRSAGEDTHDQLNVKTPAEALRLGASAVVIKREVLGKPDRMAALKKVIGEIGEIEPVRRLKSQLVA